MSFFNKVLANLARRRDWGAVQRWLQVARQRGAVLNRMTYTTLISAVSKRGQGLWKYQQQQAEANLLEATRLLNEALAGGITVDIILMNSVLAAAAQAGRLKEAEGVYQTALEEGLSPTAVTFNTLINAALRAEDLQKAEDWLQRSKDFGFRPTAQTFTPFLAYAGRMQDVTLSDTWLDRMLAEGVKPDLITYSTLISGASKAGNPQDAEVWLQRAVDAGMRPNKVCYASVMDSYARKGDASQCLARFSDMELAGVNGGIMELNVALKACASAVPPDEDRAALILEMISERRLHPDSTTVQHLSKVLGGHEAAQSAASAVGLNLQAAGSRNSAGRQEVHARHPVGTRPPTIPPGRRGQKRIYIRTPASKRGGA